jgi:hypothetical protein
LLQVVGGWPAVLKMMQVGRGWSLVIRWSKLDGDRLLAASAGRQAWPGAGLSRLVFAGEGLQSFMGQIPGFF